MFMSGPGRHVLKCLHHNSSKLHQRLMHVTEHSWQQHRALSSTFVPPPLNTYNGTSEYDNIDISAAVENEASTQRNSDPDAVFVVSGASRGIGLQYCKSLLSRTSGKIVACVRDPDNVSSSLTDLINSHSESRLDIVPLDVTSQDQVDRAAAHMESQYDGRVDALFNVVGILGDGGATTPGPERNLAQLDRDWLTKNMELNVIAPLMLSKALSPMMRSKKGKKYSRSPTVIVNMSARVGSIADHNRAGLGWHSYRMSKAALNMGTRVMSHELKRQGTWTVALYPGFTDTDLSKPFQKGVKENMIFPVDFTVGRMLDVVDGMEETHSGGLYDWAGQSLPF